MNLRNHAIALLGTVMAVSPLALPIQAQSLQSVVARADRPSSNSAETLVVQGIEQAKQGNNEAAILTYTRALQADPNYAVAYLHRGISYHDINDFDQAIADFQKVTQIDTQNAEAFFNLGEAYSHFDDPSKALESLSQSHSDQT